MSYRHRHIYSHLLSPSSLSLNSFYSLGLMFLSAPSALLSFRLNKCYLAGKWLWIQMLPLSHSLIRHSPSRTLF